METISLNTNAIKQTIKTLTASPYDFVYDYGKHRYELLQKDGKSIAFLRLPINYQIHNDLKADDEIFILLLLIQSGSCALGIFSDREVFDHKVIKSYMVRKKQGKSQVKYLNKKGKSRAGSRVRLSNTLDFFDNINERLQQYFDHYEIERIALSCSKTLLPYLYNAKVSCPFSKSDSRLYKVPKHINAPNYEILQDSHAFLLSAELIFEEKYSGLIQELLH